MARIIFHVMLLGTLFFQIGCDVNEDIHMKPSISAKEFKKFIESSDKSISDISPANAVELTLEFYRKFRAINCPMDDNGDMFLYQLAWSACALERYMRILSIILSFSIIGG
ncbi:MAG: hypothetical protein FP814_14755 [Desulfobacterium sp.]|nr:hypothetical protein [Desulfobacterium sp.]MBU3948512.1 hypothetical protein [Pseudomonadota bacterium]MBU4034790.1 hypothetical protein [Pseudomonadota bacterium]